MKKLLFLVLISTCVCIYATENKPTPRKKALIFGATGQDGSYLAEFLINKGYEVHGVMRRTSLLSTGRVDHIYQDPHETAEKRFILHYGDVTDATNVISLIQHIQPEEIYNLAAQSHVAVSFELPEYTAQVDGIGTLRIIEAIRILNLEKKTKFYQASTSELFGKVQEVPQTEKTPFYPRSPYGVAKLYGYWITKNYREAYGIFACNGILFNHESPRRGRTFVSRKITFAVAKIKYGLEKTVYLGNLDARRDWGHARDYVEAMWLMLQQDHPTDFVIATGEMHTVREFAELAFSAAGIEVEWHGSGDQEYGINKATGEKIVAIDPKYFRPTEVDQLCGNATKAKTVLGWQPKTNFYELVKEMVASDLLVVQKQLPARNNVIGLTKESESSTDNLEIRHAL